MRTGSARSTCCAPPSPREPSPGRRKVRAMQIISELEGYRRGPYAGAVLYALPGGPLDACIAIRTIVLHEGVAHLQAGAGIVADSDPRAEHEECLRKLAALEAAIDLAEEGGMMLLIDNYDSFTYNLAHLFGELGVEVTVRRNDEIDADEAAAARPRHLVISPGPGRPERRDLGRRRPRGFGDDADARGLPRAPGDRRGVRRRGRLRARAAARQGEPGATRRHRPLHRPAGAVRRRPLPLARGDPPPGRSWSRPRLAPRTAR